MSNLTSTSASLSWGASTGGTKVEGYRVLRGPTGVTLNTTNLIATTDAVASYSATHLYSGTSYQFGIVAIDTDNNQSLVRTITLSTPSSSDTSTPSAPTSVAVSAFSSTRLDLTWTASSSSNVAGYRVFRDGTQVGIVDLPGSPRYSDNGFAASSTHSYTVKAMSSNKVLSAASTARSATTLASGTVKIARGPLLERVTTTSAEVAWWTNIPTQSVVSYGIGAYSQTITNTTAVVQHVIQLPALTAASTYQYNVGNGTLSSSGASFHTAALPGTGFSFAAVGDFGGGGTGESQNAALIASDGSQFIQTLGDNIYPSSGLPDPNFSTTYSDFDTRFYKQFASAISQKSFNPADGNKEYYGDGEFWQNFDMPNNHRYYSYDWGDAHFIVLDSELPFDTASAQYAWLQNDLNTHQNAKWRIVALQRPPYSSSSSSSSCSSCKTYLVPLFQTGHVNLVLGGNSHNYERSFPLVNGSPATGGITYVVSGAGGNGFNQFTISQPAWSAFRESTDFEHLLVNVSPTQLTVNAVRAADGTVLDSVVIPFTGTVSGPTQPANFQALATGQTTVALSWSASSDSGSTITGYKVYRNNAPVTTVGASTLTYNDSGLNPATTYAYGVSAIDAASKESTKAAASATTLAAAAHFLVSTPAGAAVGTPFQETVTAQDSNNQTVTNYTGGKTLSWSGLNPAPDGTGPGLPANPVTFTSGVATVSITPYAAETTALGVNDGNGLSGSSGSFTVAPGAATAFKLSTPSGATAGQAFNETVTAVDSHGNTSTGYTSSGSSGGGSSVAFVQEAGATETSAANSLSVPISSAGGDLLVASISMYTGGTYSVSSVTDSGGNTWRRVGSPLLVSGHNSRGELWYSLTSSPASSVQANYSGTISSAISVSEFSGVAALDVSAGTSNTGTAASSGTTTALSTSGELAVGFAAIHSSNAAITSTATGYTATTQRNSAVSSALVGVRAAYKLNAGPASETFTATTPSVYWAAAVATFTPKSGGGGGGSLQWSGLSNSPNQSAPAYSNSANFVNGVATVSITPKDAETAILHVSDTNIGGTSASFAVSAGPVSSLSLSNPAASQTAGTAFDETITALDAFGNAISGSQTLSWSGLSNSPAPYNRLPGVPTSATFTNGSVTVQITPYRAESAALTLTIGSTSSGATTGFTVSPGALDKLSLSNPASQQTAGIAFDETITATDAYGNAISGSQTLSWSGLGTSPAPSNTQPSAPTNATLTNGTVTVSITPYRAESTSLTLTIGTIASPATAGFTVSAAALNTLSLSAPDPGSNPTPTAGAPFSETITALDAYSNGISGSATLSWSGLGTSPAPSSTPPVTPNSAIFGNDGTVTVQITPYKAESTNLTVSIATISSSPTANFTVAPGYTATFIFNLQSPVTQGVAGNSADVSAFDSWSNLQTGDTSALQLSSSDTGCNAGGGVWCPSTVTLSNGQQTFSFGFTDCTGAGSDQSITLTETATLTAVQSASVQPVDPLIGCVGGAGSSAFKSR